jgi:hypothetical protein
MCPPPAQKSTCLIILAFTFSFHPITREYAECWYQAGIGALFSDSFCRFHPASTGTSVHDLFRIVQIILIDRGDESIDSVERLVKPLTKRLAHVKVRHLVQLRRLEHNIFRMNLRSEAASRIMSMFLSRFNSGALPDNVFIQLSINLRDSFGHCFSCSHTLRKWDEQFSEADMRQYLETRVAEHMDGRESTTEHEYPTAPSSPWADNKLRSICVCGRYR